MSASSASSCLAAVEDGLASRDACAPPFLAALLLRPLPPVLSPNLIRGVDPGDAFTAAFVSAWGAASWGLAGLRKEGSSVERPSPPNALIAHETRSGNAPATISAAASAAVESDLRRATTSEGSGSGMRRRIPYWEGRLGVLLSAGYARITPPETDRHALPGSRMPRRRRRRSPPEAPSPALRSRKDHDRDPPSPAPPRP
jgi:hypothetical protein